jgi:hypothetical protein
MFDEQFRIGKCLADDVADEEEEVNYKIVENEEGIYCRRNTGYRGKHCSAMSFH